MFDKFACSCFCLPQNCCFLENVLKTKIGIANKKIPCLHEFFCIERNLKTPSSKISMIPTLLMVKSIQISKVGKRIVESLVKLNCKILFDVSVLTCCFIPFIQVPEHAIFKFSIACLAISSVHTKHAIVSHAIL